MATVTNQTKHTATLTNPAEHNVSVTNQASHLFDQLLLLETGSYLLMENSDFFKLDQSIAFGVAVTNQTKHG